MRFARRNAGFGSDFKQHLQLALLLFEAFWPNKAAPAYEFSSVSNRFKVDRRMPTHETDHYTTWRIGGRLRRYFHALQPLFCNFLLNEMAAN